ncbi:hypothetical protein [Pseudoalteromonas sp. MMG012]|uniref:hypothetical protein n=1 Tax=Pseudoalteromonas sp. MMG012 TaxID=2822686 RepID=UPI001FFC499F|nr:hypothetical protein [Pseudoalteromonas sp. MMG012]
MEKKIKYGKKLEVLEVLEKVHSAGTGLDVCLNSMHLDAVLFAKSEDECVKSQHEERYKLFYKKYLEGVDRIKLLHAELLVKSRLLKAINQDKEVHNLMTNVISVQRKFINKVPVSIPIDSQNSKALLGLASCEFGNENNRECSKYRNYLYNSLGI